MPSYTIELRPSAGRALRRLDPQVRKVIATVIDDLAANPRPTGAKALTGHQPYLRVRSGDYRVIYTVNDTARTITIAVVGHRREIYRKLDL